MEFYLTQYYCREKFYNTMRVLAESVLNQSPDNHIMKLQYSISLILENKIGEALRELENLVDKSEICLASVLAMIYAQNLCEVPDGEALVVLEDRMKTERKRASESALYYAANFYLQMENHAKAREYEDMIFRGNRNSAKGLLIKGWLELSDGKLTKAADCFRAVMTQDNQNFEAAIGEIRSLSRDDAITRLNQLIVKYPKFTPPLIEKMKLMLMDRDWDQAMDIAERIWKLQPNCIPALQLNILHNICVKGNYNVIHDCEHLMSEIIKQEPRSWSLHCEFGTMLSRICGSTVSILNVSIMFIKEAMKLDPDNIALNLELGYQYYLCRNYQDAASIYKRVAKLDNSVTEALMGLTKCRLETDSKDVVKEQIDFLLDVYNAEPNPDLLYLKAVMEKEKVAEKLLKDAIEMRLHQVHDVPFGLKYLVALDVNFILNAVEKLPSSVECNKYKMEVLLKVTDILPGLNKAWIQLVNVHMDEDDFKNAEDALRHILNNLNDTDAEASLLLAHVLIRQQRFDEAEMTLNTCLSENLGMRSKPLFHLLSGKIQKHRNNFRECVECLQTALKCISGSTETLKPLDLASLYLDLSSSYQILRQPDKAADSIQKATHLLQGTSQEDQILMARTDLELWRNDPNKALALLSSIAPNSPMYLEARMKMADIYLKHNKDTKKYIECYRELTEEYPTQENLIKLAEAYFSIRNINEAVNIYEKAIKKKPSPKLSKKLAELYLKCHQYGKAMRCYREAGVEGSLDLAHLLFALEQWEMAEITLSHVPLNDKATLLAKIKEKLGDIPTAINVLNEAYKKINHNSNNKSVASQICCQMAEYEASLHNFDSAIKHYKLALSHIDENSKENLTVQIALSKLYLQVNDWAACQAICSALLAKDSSNELALLMSADLSFRKYDFVTAYSLFSKLLVQKPTYWLALARTIEVKRRMGCLKDAVEHLENAAAVNQSDPGLTYCTGLYNWYNNNFSDALKFFNYVKHDLEWGQQALHNMVEIHLVISEHQDTANALLQEIHPNSPEEETNRTLLVNFVLLASKDKQLVEKAMNELTLLASRDVLRVGASLGLAMGYMLQKQPQRARNVLKIIAKTAWQFEEAEYLERCWLMLADHYVQSSKHELACELIKKILTYNLGCWRAHELYGIISEKDQKYGEPTSHYMKAWSLSGQNDPALGYRLGLYFLKAKKYVDAISTCQAMFKKNTDNGGCPPSMPVSVHEYEKCKSERMRKKLGQQHRSKSECKDSTDDDNRFGESSSQSGSSQKLKKEKVKKRQATVPNSSSMSSSLDKEHTSRLSSSNFSCCQCHHPNTPTTDAVCRK